MARFVRPDFGSADTHVGYTEFWTVNYRIGCALIVQANPFTKLDLLRGFGFVCHLRRNQAQQKIVPARFQLGGFNASAVQKNGRRKGLLPFSSPAVKLLSDVSYWSDLSSGRKGLFHPLNVGIHYADEVAFVRDVSAGVKDDALYADGGELLHAFLGRFPFPDHPFRRMTA